MYGFIPTNTPYHQPIAMSEASHALNLREVAEENHEEVPASGWLKWDEMGVVLFWQIKMSCEAWFIMYCVEVLLFFLGLRFQNEKILVICTVWRNHMETCLA